MKHIELFKNGFDSTITEKIKPKNWPYVGRDMVTGEIVYTLVPEPWVTFTAEEASSSIGLEKLSTNQTLEYSTDTTTWNTFDTTTDIPLNNGDKVYVRGVLSADNAAYSDYTQFKMSGKIAASGNCNALWNYEDLNAPLKKCCGYCMFYNCASLTTAPELPATTLTNYCYYCMFGGCTSLTTAPILLATELAPFCYSHMFISCSLLTIVPEILPATTLAYSCYDFMFNGCTSLVTAPELPATTLTTYCYANMFNNCTSLVTAPELPATELADNCYYAMFSDCTALTTTPELPATKLTKSCYYCMFIRCNNLQYIKCLATNISAYNCTYYWVSGLSNTGTFIKHPDMTGWKTGTNGIPSGWTVVDADI
jgi:hypothetical protein